MYSFSVKILYMGRDEIFCKEFVSFEKEYLEEIRNVFVDLSGVLDVGDFEYVGSDFMISEIQEIVHVKGEKR